jgi:hypothetical protein
VACEVPHLVRGRLSLPWSFEYQSRASRPQLASSSYCALGSIAAGGGAALREHDASPTSMLKASRIGFTRRIVRRPGAPVR